MKSHQPARCQFHPRHRSHWLAVVLVLQVVQQVTSLDERQELEQVRERDDDRQHLDHGHDEASGARALLTASASTRCLPAQTAQILFT